MPHARRSILRSRAAEIRAMRDFAELAGDWFWEQDAEYRYTDVFGVATDQLRLGVDKILGRRRWELPLTGITPERIAAHKAAVERHESFRHFVYGIIGEGGETQYYMVSGTPVFDGRGRFLGYHGLGRNVTAQRGAEIELKRTARKLSQIMEGNPVPMFVLDTGHRVTHWNRALAALTGLREADLAAGTPPWKAFYPEERPLLADLVLDGAPEERIRAFYPSSQRSALDQDGCQTEAFFPGLGEGGRWLLLTATVLRDAEGQPLGAIQTLQDQTRERAALQALENLATRDFLTGLANRRRFDEVLADEWARARRAMRPLALLMMDVDHFKPYNDAYGHPEGDAALQRIARALEGATHRPTDLVARFGGEEFALVMPSTDARGAEVVAERVLQGVRDLGIQVQGGSSGRLSLSIGVAAVVPGPLEGGAEVLVAAADRALYQAKHSGRDRICMHY